MWPFTRKGSQSRKAESHVIQDCFPVGPYSLDSHPSEDILLRPLSEMELGLLAPGMTFIGEEIVWAPPVDFEELHWDVLLGLVHGAIYKISLQHTGPRANVGHFNRFFAIRCNRDFAVGRGVGDAQVWNARNGNIWVNSTNLGGEAIVAVTLTSNAVRKFQRAT